VTGGATGPADRAAAAPPPFSPLIVAFSCNWCSYAGADLAGISRMQYPPTVRLVRLMCSGRVHPAFVLRALELGADGVLVSGCHPGDCHYTFGNKSAELEVASAQRLAAAAGLSPDRVRLQWVSASEGALFARTVSELSRRLVEIGPSPLRVERELDACLGVGEAGGEGSGEGAGEGAGEAGRVAPDAPGARLQEAFAATHAFRCIECGKCTGICPVTAHLPSFIPRRLVVKGLYGMEDELAADPSMWACLTCGLCKEACRVDVDLPEFFRRVRGISRAGGSAEVPTHGGLVHTFERLCSHPALAPRINGWAEAPGLRLDPASDTAFVAGAAAALADIVNDVPYDPSAVPRAAVRVLSAIGVQPRLVEGERPSGHDLFYSGEDEAFARLARLNVDALRATRAKRAVFACPETMHAYRDLYPRVLGEALGVECVHLVQPLAEAVRAGKVAFRPMAEGAGGVAIAYHDSCRMGRSLGLYDEPRLVLEAAGARLVELANNRAYAQCCGVGAWQRCDPASRRIRLGRLAEARAAGASILISPCSRCTLHFQCQACHDGTGTVNSGETKIMDLAVYVADRIAHQKVG